MINNRSNFLELLIRNDNNELKEYLLCKGKNPKPICPIQFVSNNNETEQLEIKENE